ncbi:MAG: hypothetical protein K8U03_12685 [Planctomycetia bacterium]|nr:hypothetical protein [Planctomycetia bacterium]
MRLATANPFPAIPMILGLVPNSSATNSTTTLVLWLAGLAIMTLVGVYVVGKLRGSFRGSDFEASNLITNFRELHSQGELSDEEYRNIKSKLAMQLQESIEKAKSKDSADS